MRTAVYDCFMGERNGWQSYNAPVADFQAAARATLMRSLARQPEAGIRRVYECDDPWRRATSRSLEVSALNVANRPI